MVGLSIAFFFLGFAALAFLVAGLIRPKWGMPWSKQASRFKSTGLWIGVFIASSILMAVASPREDKGTVTVSEAPAPAAPVPTEEATAETPAPTEYVPPVETASTGPAAAEPKASGENMDAALECQKKLKIANEAGILLDLQPKPGRMVMVVDGPTWNQTPFDAKLGFVKTVVCMITVADSSKSARVEVRDNVNNHIVGEFNGVELTIP